MLNIILLILLLLIANAICFQCSKNSRKNSFNLMMSEETYGETLNSIRSAARMGDVDKLQEIVKKWQKNDILNDRTGDMMGLCPLHWAVAAGLLILPYLILLLLSIITRY